MKHVLTPVLLLMLCCDPRARDPVPMRSSGPEHDNLERVRVGAPSRQADDQPQGPGAGFEEPGAAEMRTAANRSLRRIVFQCATENREDLAHLGITEARIRPASGEAVVKTIYSDRGEVMPPEFGEQNGTVHTDGPTVVCIRQALPSVPAAVRRYEGTVTVSFPGGLKLGSPHP